MKMQCENIKKRFITPDGQITEAVKNCSSVFEEGQIVCIIGASGSGKSTLLDMLSLNLAPDSGSIFFDGQDVTALSETEQSRLRRDVIGYVPQSLGLIPILTARENIRLPAVIAGKKVNENEALYEKLEIGDILDRLPDVLSGGQKQRAAIARELLREPRIFLADEPTSALDGENIAIVTELFDELRKSRCTVIIATHDERLCACADLVYRMTDGILQAVRNQRDA